MEIIWGRFVEKTGGQKSRATVPLNRPSLTAVGRFAHKFVGNSAHMP
jgi:hypothetical protein